MIKLGFVHKNQLVKKFVWKGSSGALMVGRSEACDVVLPNNRISSQHLQLVFDDSGILYLIDQNSTNGTYVNNRRIQPGIPVEISPNDSVYLSDPAIVKLVFNPDNFNSGEFSNPSNNPEEDTNAVSNLLKKLKNSNTATIGRNPDNDVILDHPNVSRYHAQVERVGNVYYINDLNSTNGTFVNGRKIYSKTEIAANDTIFIGRFKLSLNERASSLSSEIAIKADAIKKIFSNGKIGLHTMSLEVPSNHLIALMGPSGCGKTTLMKVLNGVAPATEGEVYLCGLEINQHYNYLKTQIGYVPQDDIVHQDLTVEQSLRYAAKLRLKNCSEEEINDKIKQVLDNLRISDKRHSLVKDISGGQRKRVSIAVEILNDPLILFLDEPTSPLDPETIEEFLNNLKRLSENGTTVVMITHKPEDLNYMDKVIFLAEDPAKDPNGGHIVYQGSSKNFLSYFGVSNVVTVYSKLNKKHSQEWIDKYNQTAIHPNKGKPHNSSFKREATSVNYFSQYWWLTMRYLSIKLNNKLSSAIIFGQAILIAILICLIYPKIEISVPFFITITAVWLGTNNAAREIVGEMPIYLRERMFNQSIFTYILSKLTVLGIFAAIQCVIFISILYFKFQNLSVPLEHPLNALGWMILVSIASTLMGLLISASFSSIITVITLVPIVLLPQILLAGIITPITSKIVEYLSYLTISRWSTEEFCHIQEKVMVASLDSTASNPPDKPNAYELLKNNFHKETYNDLFGSWVGKEKLDIVMISIMIVVFFAAIVFVLKQKDPVKINK